MKIKQTVRHFSLSSAAFIAIVLCFSLSFSSAVVFADPAVTQVTCKDGKEVTAHKDDAPPNDILNDADFKKACKSHGGYNVIDETIVCKDDSMQSVYKDLADPKDKLDDKDRKEACKSHGGIKPSDTEAVDGCGGAQTSIIKCDADNSGGLETNGVWALLLMAINILTAGIGIAAIGGVVYGSILYTTAGDNEAQVKQAKETIRNVVIGVVAYVAMFALLQFIIPGGIFS